MSMYPPPGQETPGDAAPYGPPAPQYGQPAPEFGQPAPYGAPDAAWGQGFPVPPAPKSRKTLKIVLSLAAAVILVVGGVIAYFVATTVATTGKYKIVAPQSFQGLTRDDTNAAAKSMQASESGLDKAGVTPVVTTYDTTAGATVPGLIFVGAYGDTPGASLQLSEFWQGVTGNGAGTVTSKTDEPAGPLGGSMQCAILTFSGTAKVPTCVWADNSTYAALMDFGSVNSTAAVPSQLSALATETLAMRAVAEVKK